MIGRESKGVGGVILNIIGLMLLEVLESIWLVFYVGFGSGAEGSKIIANQFILIIFICASLSWVNYLIARRVATSNNLLNRSKQVYAILFIAPFSALAIWLIIEMIKIGFK